MLSVAEARARINAAMRPCEAERVALAAAGGRVLRADVIAGRDQPPGDVSAMDGYAIRGADASSLPASLTVAFEIPAGRVPPRALAPGEAARIFTGALLPLGADTIVIQENTRRAGDTVTLTSSAAPGRHIRRRGLDFAAGARVLAAPRRLSPADLALAASAGASDLIVSRRPRVAFLATGDELVPPGAAPGPGQVVASSGAGLAALLSATGATPIDLGIAPDSPTAIAAVAARAAGADLILTLGGASVGDHDLVQAALGPVGLSVDFWRIAMRPGKPLIFGHLKGIPLIGLPGNPVSSLVCAVLFVAPAVERLMGLPGSPPRQSFVRLAHDLAANDDREDYLRATLLDDPVTLSLATPFQVQDSSMLSMLSSADCLIVRPPHAAAAPAGVAVPAILLRP